MRRHTSVFVTAGLAAVLGISGVPDAASVDDGRFEPVPSPAPTYNPYPPGILPSDLDSEIARVQREVQFIFNEALNEWRALPAPTLAGNPPTLKGSGYEAVDILGKLLNFDQNMSPFRNEACGFCHMPYAGFSGPIPSVNLTMIGVSRNISLSGRQTDRAAIHVFTGFPGARIQHNAGRVLWRKLLGCALDRLQTAECRRRAGTASSGRYPGNGFSRHGLHRVSAIESGVPAAL